MSTMSNSTVWFYPSDGAQPAFARAELPTFLVASGGLQVMVQDLADHRGKDEFVCAVVDGRQVAHAYGREQRDLLDVLKTRL